MIRVFCASLFLAGAWASAVEVPPVSGKSTPLLAQAAELAAEAARADSFTVVGRDGWLFFAPELRHLGVGRFWGEAAPLVSRATKPEFADPLPAIVDFHAQLERAGIRLILVPVPPKAVIYPEELFAGLEKRRQGERFDVVHQAFYAELRRNGVEVLDLVPGFLAARESGRMYCRQDTHWSGRACVRVAEILRQMIADEPWFSSHGKRDFGTREAEIEIAGDLWSNLPDRESIERERLSLRYVGLPEGGGLAPVAPDSNSPVVLLGDSHNLVFHAGADMHAAGAGLPDQLARELGFPVDLVAVRGSGATPARINLLRRARAEGYLARKRVVIWCFGAREFTESSGWAKVPVVK